MLEFGQQIAASGPGTAGVSPAKSRLKMKIGGCGICMSILRARRPRSQGPDSAQYESDS